MARKGPSQRPVRREVDRPGSSPSAAVDRDRRDEGRSNWHYYFWALLAVAAGGVALLAWLDGLPKTRPGGTRKTPGNTAANAAAERDKTTDESAGKPNGGAGNGPTSTAEREKLLGRWLRQDGGYVLKFKDVSQPDKLAVAYLNPNEIHVARAAATRRDDALRVEIELRDVNYPGCVYELTYDQAEDRLRGTYFQAALGETYDVEFAREP